MRLESLKVNNIRSIKKADITFPDTTILFYGDIGSGKSSILKAIEFGLFGTMGDLSGLSLLRRGQNNAEVELSFSIDGNCYTIHRALKKKVKNEKETVSQPEGWLIENDTKTSYTTTELRTKILELLNYSTTKYKSSSKKCVDIFRYTVYTPQEEIKEILKSNPDDRFEILKDVLEIEKYENSLENLENIKKDLSKQLRDIDRDITAIGSPETAIPEIEKKIQTKKNDIKSIKEKIDTQYESSTKQKAILKSLLEEYNDYIKNISEITSKQELIEKNVETINKNYESLQKLANEILKKQEELEKLPQIEEKFEKNEKEVEEEIKNLRTKGENLSNSLTTWKNKLANVEKLLREGKCALCGQAIHDKKRFDEELEDAKNKVSSYDNELSENKKLITEFEEILQRVRKQERITQKRNSILEVIKGKTEHQTDLNDAKTNLTADIEKMNAEINDALKSYNIKSLEETEAYGKMLKEKYDSQDKIVETINTETTQYEKKLSSLETELENIISSLKEKKEALEHKQKLKEKLEYLSSVKTWVSDQFPILLKDIERTILATTASLFNQYFKEWFRALVEEENIDIQINPENFEPIVIVDGYESPFADLSGGERSALSLAYRLALNKVINAKHQDVRTKDLLILDEPTDGFSEEQVNKMQGVFDTLDMKQMIIISHERTLDSFVSKIFNFEKKNHQTKISIKNV